MRKKIIGVIVGSILASLANAAPVIEAEVTGTATNNTTAGAQAIPDASFTTPVPPTVFDPPGWPTATVSGKGGGNDVDFYSFSTAGGGALFDIDNAVFTFDTVLSLFTGAGTLIAWNDDSDPADPGSAAGAGDDGTDALGDSFIGTIILPAGNYFIAVSQYPNFANAIFSIATQDALVRPDGGFGGWLVGGATPGDSSFTSNGNDMGLAYTLHISLESPGVIPEPQTYALMLAGLGLLGFAARRREKAA
jgi:hypothetical protein